MTQEEFKSIKEIEKGCGAISKGEIKGVNFITTCGDTGFNDNLALCEVCLELRQNTLAIIKMIDDIKKNVLETETERTKEMTNGALIVLSNLKDMLIGEK